MCIYMYIYMYVYANFKYFMLTIACHNKILFTYAMNITLKQTAFGFS